MKHSEHYPRYLSYRRRRLQPSVLTQEYPLPSLGANEVYYPANKILESQFTTENEFQMFGASQFCSFLNDTIEVEHGLVIPAIATLRRLPYKLPDQPKLDLYKTATDEGYHAEQSLAYLSVLETHFGLPEFSGSLPPLFIRRLEQQRNWETNPHFKQLITLLNGIVTETRISIELSHFAIDSSLSDSVRSICLTHAQDEVIHSSQFQALGNWLWEELDEKLRAIVSKFYIESTISRSLPDIDSIIISFSKATGRSLEDATHLILSRYNEEILINEMMIAAKPTLDYLKKLGIENYISIASNIDKERSELQIALAARRRISN